MAIHYLRREQRLAGRDEKLPPDSGTAPRGPPCPRLGAPPACPRAPRSRPPGRRAWALKGARKYGGAGGGRCAAGGPSCLPPAQSVFQRPSLPSFPGGPFLRSPSPPRSRSPSGALLSVSLVSLTASLSRVNTFTAFLPISPTLSATFFFFLLLFDSFCPPGSPNPPPGPLLLLLFTACPGVRLLCPLHRSLWAFLAQTLHVSPSTLGRLQPCREGRW